jgi:NAD(P)-dependent dehydrogenase (short-subunit alcohol dehydrogenase family)
MAADLRGQTAIITGAGRGIGRAIAIELASLGASVAVADLDAESAARTAAELEATGHTALDLRVDISVAADRAGMVRAVLDRFGQIDVLVNNAGINRRAAPMEITEASWDETMDVNARGTFFCCQAVLPTMLAARRGAIVNISSQSGKIGSANGLVYCASKAAVISVTRSLALAVARQGIRVNCVCPGSIWTDMWAEVDREVGVAQLGLEPGEYRRQRGEKIPLGRLGEPEDVARVVGFLVSAGAGYMTGQAVNVTGGVIMF